MTAVALSDVIGKFSSREVIDTPADPDTAIEALSGAILRLKNDAGNRKVEGVGLAGRLHLDSDRLAFAPNLNWAGVDAQAFESGYGPRSPAGKCR